MSKTDVLFIHPNASTEIYQDLAKEYSAIEPPIWAALLANHVRTRGFAPEIMDCEAMAYSDDIAVHHIGKIAPRLIVMVVYGQQPSASNQNMEGAVRLTKAIKNVCNIPIMFVGIYPSALPRQTLEAHPEIDFVATGEGVYTISDLLKLDLQFGYEGFLRDIKGLGYRTKEEYKGDTPGVEGLVDCIHITPPAVNVKQEDLAKDLPGMAWDLLPMSRYRTALWHALPNGANRKPFASLYTSLGCPFSCTFCCINAPFGGSSFRYWPPEFMIEEFAKLHEMGITNVKIADEMFVMKPDHFMRLCELIIARGYKFNIWCYARVDITKPQYLETLKKAGVNWLALGIESGNKDVRKGVIKGRFDDVDIRKVVETIRNSGINVIGNYIFGLPDDTESTMLETLAMAMEMNTEEANFYSCMAYPGSKLHKDIIDIKTLPETYSGYSQHSYDCKPLPTKYLTAAQVLAFRDEAWHKYHTNPAYVDMIYRDFGETAWRETLSSTKIRLKRKLLGD
jgi:anaerobic magnesium-protoporphyrin IX monomethyl ester cyclase